MGPSADMLPKQAKRWRAIQAVHEATRLFHEFASDIFREFAPNEYADYEKSYRSCQSNTTDTPHGLWLGKALLCDVQTGPHVDGSDGSNSWCCIWNMGRYDAEEGNRLKTSLLLPDLEMALV